jgi:transcriptional regulator with XRE-family HTH domain
MAGSQPPDAHTIGALVAANLRRLRAGAELSIGQLAQRAGLSKSTVSALESGTANPNIETLWALAVALGTPFGQLITQPPETSVRLIKAGEGARVDFGRDGRHAVRLLASTSQRSARDLYILEAEPARVRAVDAHAPGTIEHVVCAAGRMRLGPLGQEVVVEPGDYAVFAGDVPHVYQALAPGTRALLVMEYQ